MRGKCLIEDGSLDLPISIFWGEEPETRLCPSSPNFSFKGRIGRKNWMKQLLNVDDGGGGSDQHQGQKIGSLPQYVVREVQLGSINNAHKKSNYELCGKLGWVPSLPLSSSCGL